MIRALRRTSVFVLALGVLSCGDDSNGGGEGSGTESEGSGTSGTSGATTTAGSTTDPSATGQSSTTTAGTTTSTSSPTSTSTPTTSPTEGTDTNTAVCELSESFTCSAPVDCGDEGCGGQDSPFDEDGCLRPVCARHRDCTDGGVCYHPVDYDGCASSGIDCADGADGTCECTSDPDCGGAYCIPPEQFFGGAEVGPTEGWADNECAPNDAAAFLLQLGLNANACDGEIEGPLVQIRVYVSSGTTGTFDISEDGGLVTYHPDGNLAEQEVATGAVIRIFSWDNDMVVGEYEFGLADTTVLVNSFAVPFCDSEVMCG